MGCVKSGFRGGNGAQKDPMHTHHSWEEPAASDPLGLFLRLEHQANTTCSKGGTHLHLSPFSVLSRVNFHPKHSLISVKRCEPSINVILGVV